MRKNISELKFTTNLLSIILSIIFSSITVAQDFDTDVPVGWAVVPGYAASLDGLETTTGGAGGEVVIATTGSQLASYASGTEARIIFVQGTLTGSDVNIGSNKTTVGVGSDAKISKFYLNMNGPQNVIIRNLEITLFDATGRIVNSEFVNGQIHTLNMSDLPTGFYMIKISGNNLNKVVNITKQ